MSDAKIIKFKDFITLQRGFDLFKSEYRVGLYPVVGATEISGYHDEYKLNGPGITVGRVGTIGFVQLINENFWPHQDCLFVKDYKGNELLYVYYVLKALPLSHLDAGGAVPAFNRNHLDHIAILLPSKNIQIRIAAVLSAYDKLIEINTQRIKLLEETAEDIYKEWFVRMRFPGREKAKFTKGIPKEWQIKPIGKVIDYSIGGGWGEDKSDTQFSVSGYVIRGTDIPGIRQGRVNKEVYRFHKASNIKSRELIEGDIVFETAGGSEGQPLGRTCYITNEVLEAYGDKVMAASFCKQVRTTSIPSMFLYYFLNYLYDTGMIEAFQVQSTGISNYQFEPFLKFQQILLPSDKLMPSFHDQAIVIQKQIAALGIQNDQLRQIRDRLLPRLISGKLTIKQ